MTMIEVLIKSLQEDVKRNCTGKCESVESCLLSIETDALKYSSSDVIGLYQCQYHNEK